MELGAWNSRRGRSANSHDLDSIKYTRIFASATPTQTSDLIRSTPMQPLVQKDARPSGSHVGKLCRPLLCKILRAACFRSTRVDIRNAATSFSRFWDSPPVKCNRKIVSYQSALTRNKHCTKKRGNRRWMIWAVPISCGSAPINYRLLTQMLRYFHN